MRPNLQFNYGLVSDPIVENSKWHTSAAYPLPRNLCALDWKERNPHGSTTDLFKYYYDHLRKI